ncbi:MAG TPA: dehydrogenase, partial [Roseivirga sp.]
MNSSFYFKSCLLLTLVFAFTSCQEDFEEPEISLETYQVAEGFQLEVVASEPFLEAPVAIDFDNQGRIWAVEMRGYMQTLTGESETMPNGVISIQEDLDKDGVVDHSKVFLDGLVLPRAIALVYDGLLYAEPPNLWFVEIENDQPGKKVLVDSLYAAEGNVEHMPNGLMMNVDNWIYNARSHFRYQRKNGQWIKEPTSFRGQWGITKDNFGRLYYNNNSTQIMGDYALPNVLINNPYYTPKVGISKVLTRNQRVYPLQATAVNRGYQQGVLDADSMLVNVTSSCGPLVYRGGAFPEEFDQNAFVCIPEVNSVKRNFLNLNEQVITAEQAYDDREFIASTDEGFRPVNLFNGPDGGMYIVDMHRGIIQHGAYMSPYLREKLAEKGLDKIIGMGRILRVKHEDKTLDQMPDFESLNGSELVNLLRSDNGWIRDRAQQYLVNRQPSGAQKALEDLLASSASSVTKVHALYSLDGMNVLSRQALMDAAKTADPQLTPHALRLLASSNMNAQAEEELQLLSELLTLNQPLINLYLKAFTGDWIRLYGAAVQPLISQMAEMPMTELEEEAIVSGLSGHEETFTNWVKSDL